MPRYIDADAFDADCRKRYCTDCENYNGIKCKSCWVADMLDEIENAPTVSPDEVRGVVKWIRISGYHLDHEYHPARYQCDKCKHFVDSGDDKNYCPNCGARMGGVQDALS